MNFHHPKNGPRLGSGTHAYMSKRYLLCGVLSPLLTRNLPPPTISLADSPQASGFTQEQFLQENLFYRFSTPVHTYRCFQGLC